MNRFFGLLLLGVLACVGCRDSNSPQFSWAGKWKSTTVDGVDIAQFSDFTLDSVVVVFTMSGASAGTGVQRYYFRPPVGQNIDDGTVTITPAGLAFTLTRNNWILDFVRTDKGIRSGQPFCFPVRGCPVAQFDFTKR